MKEQIEKQAIEEIAKVIETTEQIARDAHCGLPSPTMYAKDLYWHGCRKIPNNIGELSDGYHTFNELYHHRAVLFSVICNMMPKKAWKSKLHDTGDMFDGMFIVGIETEQGQATYHYNIEPYWDMFKVKELEKAPKWDGHTAKQAIARIGSINRKQSEGEWEKRTFIIFDSEKVGYHCSECNTTWDTETNFCPNCGAHMKGGK